MNHSSIRRAKRTAGNRIGKGDSLAGQTVDMGSRNIPASIHTAHIGAKLIIKNEEDIRFFPGRLLFAARNCQRSGSHGCYLKESASIHPFIIHRATPAFKDVSSAVSVQAPDACGRNYNIGSSDLQL
jgi:hypothetical protein